ncbi:MAG: type II toxin-antitoxin system VapC family toxin [Desulfobacterales bacterium]|uniref:Type II toxin-antitoxin system VapC family toxin n=1 Tax=Candidatus Desulfatibia vada TaxID=2841696 RepID=A0A8J6P349_9BACT|nr:type II toxin-antitoxin system VapC family toxin [Candidatus Desulfatibia vada]MBL6972089.1 type II toxin-antitoxin system VapC family toxin [Desulfobacterales bacterium]
MPGPNSFVLDSFALIGYFENESFSDQIQHALIQAKSGTSRLYLHAIHIGEVYYITLREQGKSLADLAYSRIKALPIKLIDRIDEELLLAAAGLKAKYPISYADSFAAALAMIKNCPLITGDPEFRSLEKQGIISIEWLI